MIIHLKTGSKVTFDNDKINLFKAETSSDSPDVKEYQRLVLAGIDQVGTVKENDPNLSTVLFADGWEIPIPTKYLIVLPD